MPIDEPVGVLRMAQLRVSFEAVFGTVRAQRSRATDGALQPDFLEDAVVTVPGPHSRRFRRCHRSVSQASIAA